MQLRSYQRQALKAGIKNIKKNLNDAKGRFVIPTGGGKTSLEAYLLEWQIRRNVKTNIHIVLAPRILLCNQLIRDYRAVLGPGYRAIAFHSGTHEPDYSVIKWKEEATTSLQTIKKYIRNAKKLKQPLVIFSTYHSCGRLSSVDFDTLIADESQYCVAENFNESIRSLCARVKLFFTATEKMTASAQGFGLNNKDVYGSRWFQITADELINKGYIVPPRLHVMHGETVDSHRSFLAQVKEIANQQIILTNQTLPYSKVLFATNGTTNVKTIEENLREIQEEFPSHDIFTITSSNGAQINGNKVKREIFLEELKSRDNCLIFHYDILSEGIDVDGITGVVLMRNMGLSKLLQTIGRAVRLYKPDPSLKPQAWISVPVINGNEDDKERVRSILYAMRSGGFDISSEDVIETKKNDHTTEEQDLEDDYDITKRSPGNLFVEEIFHEIEEGVFWDEVEKKLGTENMFDELFEVKNEA